MPLAEARGWLKLQMVVAPVLVLLREPRAEVCQPLGAVFHDGTEWSWMSERIAAALEHWHPDMRDVIVNVDEVGRMLVLDALIFNEDRHRRNIMVEPVEDEAHLRLWAIDAGEARIGHVAEFVSLGLRHPSPRNHARGLPITALNAAAMAGAQVAEGLSDEAIQMVVSEACGIAREPDISRLTGALINRCRHARQIVSGYLVDLGALP